LILRWWRGLVGLRSSWDDNGAWLDSDGERHRDWLLRLDRRIVLSGDGGLRGAILVNRSSLGSSVLLSTGYWSWSRRSLGRVISGWCWSWWRSSVIMFCMVVTVSVSTSVTSLSKNFGQLTFFCDLVILEPFVYSVIGNCDIITGNRNAFYY
jgi:hypothetical protein